MGFSRDLQGAVDPTGGIGSISGASAADAAAKAAEDFENRINEAQAVQQASNPLAQRAFTSGIGGARQDLLSSLFGAQDAISGGFGSQISGLRDAQNLFGGAAGVGGQALGQLQNLSTAGGQSELLQSIFGNQDLAPILDQAGRQASNQLSAISGRRSGAGINAVNQARLGAAQGIAGDIFSQTQNLAGIGLQGLGSQADILSQIGSAQGQRGSALAQILGQAGGQLSGLSQRGGAGLADLIQQGALNEVNLLGQLGQAQAAGTLGQSNAQAQGASNLASIGSGLASAFGNNRQQSPQLT